MSSLTSVKSFVLANVLIDPSSFWRDLPENYKRDKEFVLGVLNQSGELPSKSDFERCFPQSLRFDRDVVLAFARRSDFEEIYKTRHLFIPGTLVDDKDVMMAYCAKIPRALQEASERLTDDEDVVKIAVARDGRELQYASRRLQEALEILRLAVANNGLALLSCPLGPTYDFCFNDREFMKTVLSNHGGTMYREMTNKGLKNDPEMVILALQNGLMFRFAPESLRLDVDFLKRVLSAKSSLFSEVALGSRKYEESVLIQLAVAALAAPDASEALFEELKTVCPSVFNTRDPAVAASICKFGAKYDVSRYMSTHNYFNDREIMKLAVAACPRLFTRLAPPLQVDPEIVLLAIQADTALWIMGRLHRDFVANHPELAIRAVEVHYEYSERNTLYNLIPETLWRENQDLQVAWICRYGMLDSLRPRLSEPEFALLLAQHSESSFALVPATLRRDLDFMKRAVAVNGRVIRYAWNSIQDDDDLMCLAVSKDPSAVTAARKQRLLGYVNNKLALRDTFLSLLRGTEDATSTLAILNVGHETSAHFKRTMAECLGVPTDATLESLLKCKQNIENQTAATQARLRRTEETTPARRDDPHDIMIRRRQELRRQFQIDFWDDALDDFPPLFHRRRGRHGVLDPRAGDPAGPPGLRGDEPLGLAGFFGRDGPGPLGGGGPPGLRGDEPPAALLGRAGPGPRGDPLGPGARGGPWLGRAGPGPRGDPLGPGALGERAGLGVPGGLGVLFGARGPGQPGPRAEPGGLGFIRRRGPDGRLFVARGPGLRDAGPGDPFPRDADDEDDLHGGLLRAMMNAMRDNGVGGPLDLDEVMMDQEDFDI